jgi:hypothetical protein
MPSSVQAPVTYMHICPKSFYREIVPLIDYIPETQGILERTCDMQFGTKMHISVFVTFLRQIK